MRARLQAWTAQVQRFVAALPAEERTTPAIVNLIRRHRILRRTILYGPGRVPDQSAAMDLAWRRFQRAWDRATGSHADAAVTRMAP
jgi:hypothetical protein